MFYKVEFFEYLKSHKLLGRNLKNDWEEQKKKKKNSTEMNMIGDKFL